MCIYIMQKALRDACDGYNVRIYLQIYMNRFYIVPYWYYYGLRNYIGTAFHVTYDAGERVTKKKSKKIININDE